MLTVEFRRRERGWSQTQLSALVRIAQPTISLIEQGRFIPTPDQLARLGQQLDIPADTVLKPIAVVTPIDEGRA